MTTVGLADLRSRLYEAYASQHAGSGGDEAAALVCRRGNWTLLPPPAVGFDSVLVRSSPPVAHGLANAACTMDWEVVSTCYQIALAAMTSMLRGHIVTQNVTFAAARAR